MENKTIKQHTRPRKGFYICLTIIFSLSFCILKLFNFGWLSLILSLPIIVYVIFYIICNIFNAKIENKTKKDYLRFWGLSFFFLLSGLTFCDFGDVGPTSKIIPFISDSLSMIICQFSFVITIVICILSIINHAKKTKASI